MIQIKSMWKLLYQLASPKTFYEHSGRLLPYLALAACFTLIGGLFWALVFAPADYQQGEAYRIMFIHVPAAFLSMALYGGMGFLAVLLLVWRIKIAGLLLGCIAPIGASMTFLALITGSIWGKPMWGAWWVWDARLTAEFILLLLYLALLATQQALQLKTNRDKVLAILILVGLVDLPIIHYSVYWWNTLHQGASLTLFTKPKIAAPMLYPLLLCLLGFFLFSIWAVLVRARNELLLRERKQAWVRLQIEGEEG